MKIKFISIINMLRTQSSCNFFFPLVFVEMKKHICARGKFCEKNREIRSQKMLAWKTRFRSKFPHSYSIWNFEGVIPWFISPHHLRPDKKKPCSSDHASVIFLTYSSVVVTNEITFVWSYLSTSQEIRLVLHINLRSRIVFQSRDSSVFIAAVFIAMW